MGNHHLEYGIKDQSQVLFTKVIDGLVQSAGSKALPSLERLSEIYCQGYTFATKCSGLMTFELRNKIGQTLAHYLDAQPNLEITPIGQRSDLKEIPLGDIIPTDRGCFV